MGESKNITFGRKIASEKPEKKFDLNDPFRDEKLEFPISFHIKIIMENIDSIEDNERVLKIVLESNNIPHSDWSHKKSREQSYISFSAFVTISSKDEMIYIYNKIKEVPGVKMVI